MSGHVSIAQSIQALLLTPAITGDRVFRDRLPPIAKDWDDAIVIRLVASTAERKFTGPASPVDWATDLGVEIFKRVAANVVPSDAIDPLVDAVWARLSGAGSDLGLSVEDLMPQPRIEWELGEGQTPLVCATFAVRVLHRTQSASLAPWN